MEEKIEANDLENNHHTELGQNFIDGNDFSSLMNLFGSSSTSNKVKNFSEQSTRELALSLCT